MNELKADDLYKGLPDFKGKIRIIRFFCRECGEKICTGLDNFTKESMTILCYDRETANKIAKGMNLLNQINEWNK